MRLLPIVEGPGDIASVPLLIRRILNERHQIYDVEVLRPYKYGDSAKVSKNFVRQLLVAAKEDAAILWTMDCDDGCPVEYVNFFEQQIPASVQVPVRFALFLREFECMFLAEHQCLIDELGIAADSPRTNEPETIRGAKQRISRMMPASTAYKETVHQARLTGLMDLAVASENSRSLRHFESTLLSLVRPEGV